MVLLKRSIGLFHNFSLYRFLKNEPHSKQIIKANGYLCVLKQYKDENRLFERNQHIAVLGHLPCHVFRLYASLFDFADPWKIDIMSFMEQNYTNDLSLEEMANYTGRSLATFKRDFSKVCDLSPQKWVIRRRLEAAHALILSGTQKVTDICYSVGFKNLSHFSKAYKGLYGCSPTHSI